MASHRSEERRGAGLFVFDACRAAAALAVLLAHARSFILLDAKDQPPLSPAGQLFYAVSGLGHQAVIVFFVISGALVTGSLRDLAAGGRLSAWRFGVARLTRLWVVLVPCLVLGGLVDRAGESLGDPLVYAGRYGALRPAAPPVAVQLDATTFAGNLAFLQTIAVPPFGTNVPLWSLANEAWYYVMAYLAFALWRDRRRPARAAALAAVLAAIGAGVMTPSQWALAPAWAIGGLVALRRPGATPSRWAAGVALVLLGAVLVVVRLAAGRYQLAGDYALAGAVALMLVTVPLRPAAAGLGSRAARAVAALSYSLYLSHFPLLALLAAIGLRNRRLPFGVVGLVWLAAAMVVALAAAAAVWWLFERHTPAVRRRVACAGWTLLERLRGRVLVRSGRVQP